MDDLLPWLPFLFAVFLLAGAVKGISGMGLPTVAMALLALRMPPAQAASLLLLPSLLTNLQQARGAGGMGPLLRRLWPMLLAIAVATACSGGVLAHGGQAARLGLGAMLLLYALFGLAQWTLPPPGRHAAWLGPLCGALTGLATGATGVFVLPAVPYLVSLRLPRESLMQALGLCFSVSTIALAAALGRHGLLDAHSLSAALLVLPPTLLGLWLGTRLRARLPPRLFRRVFFLTLAGLGVEILWHALG